MMHYYAQHTATRDWFAPVLRIDDGWCAMHRDPCAADDKRV